MYRQARVLDKLYNTRHYTLSGPPAKHKGCGCPPLIPGGGTRVVPPADCRPGPIPTNPCCPNFPHGTHKTYKYLFLFIMLPLVILQYFRTCGQEDPPETECRDYEYMRRRTKRFPWGDGDKSLFHNDHVNVLTCPTSPEDMRPDFCE